MEIGIERVLVFNHRLERWGISRVGEFQPHDKPTQHAAQENRLFVCLFVCWFVGSNVSFGLILRGNVKSLN